MSGDVQPRKRKDKKKKKDEADAYMASNEDLHIHVHKEGGTGGNICAKIVFFFLFSALIVLVGLIIKENQGLSELESIESESRFSQIFEGWIDKNADDHDDHSPEIHDSHDDEEHEEDEDDDESHYESEEDNVEDDTEEEDQSENVDEDDEESDADVSTPRSEEETEEDQASVQSEDEEVNDEEEDQNSEEADEEEESKEQKDSLEKDEISKESVEEETAAADGIEEEKKEEQSKEDVEADATKAEEQEASKPGSGVAKKIFVGLALLTVAYNVFLRKRTTDIIEKPTKSSSTAGEEERPSDLSRRNTIVPPPTLQEVEPDLPDIEVEGEEYSEDEYSDEDNHSEHRTARDEYQELRKSYTRSMSPEGDFEVKDKHYEEDVMEEDVMDDEEEQEEEEVEDDYEIYDEDEDEELLKRLEAKYGKLGRDVNVPEEGDSDREGYDQSDVNNTEDYEIREDIDAAHAQLDKNAAYANKMFEALLDQYPLSPRLLYGKAKALDILAEEQQSNELLSEALSYYLRAMNTPDVSDKLFIEIADRYINRARFMGQYKKAIAVHWQLIERFPENSSYLNTLAVTYLTVNLVEEARSVLRRVMSKWPNDGFALAHYGFILKTTDNNLEDSVKYLSRGLQSGSPGVVDGRFYFHLGDALTRLNKKDEAMKIYQEGVEKKVFMSKYQRSLYNVERLTAKPWWEPQDIPAYQKLFAALTDNWKEISREGLSALNERGYFEDEAENLKDTGTWKQLELFARGQKNEKNCAKAPITCSIIQKFPDVKGCRRGQTKFSVMHPGTHVWPHCGPTNCRLRVHLGLKVPSNTYIRVAEEMRSWKEGDVIIFDDSFEHEVWHNGSDFRLVLIVDVWHPNLTPAQKRSLSPI